MPLSLKTKQVAGVTLIVGLAVVALSLSLRKRIPRFRLGSVGLWRVVHSGLGLLTLVGLIVHTGMRPGSNLNLALSTTFLGLAVLGALAGVLTSLESRVSGSGAMLLRQWRPRLTLLHILLFWPLPVLLGFHIVSVYYF